MDVTRRWALPLAFAAALGSFAAGADPVLPVVPAAQLRAVIVLSRHGVRTPLALNDALNHYSAQPWPEWPAAPGLLTPHGHELMAQMGRFYRARYVAAGLLTGDPTEDGGRLYVGTDNDDRTIQSGRETGRSILAGKSPVVHSLPAGTPDPLWVADQQRITPADKERGQAAILGRIGGDGETMRAAYGEVYREFKEVLAGRPSDGLPAPQTDVLQGSTAITLGSGKDPVVMGSFFRAAETLIGNFTLEYTDGRPMAEVGWGRLTPERLAALTELQALYFDLSKRTFPLAQMEGSDLLSHISATLRQAATGAAVDGAFGTPEQRLVILNGHDDNVENIGGLLGLSWAIPGAARNVSLPGGALVFELWQAPEGGSFRLRAYYMSETVSQMRSGAPVSPTNQPFIAPLYIPEGGSVGSDLSVSLEDFDRLTQRLIDPRFVVPIGS